MALMDIVRDCVDQGDGICLKSVLERGLAVAEGTHEYLNAGTGAQDFCNVLTSPRKNTVDTFLSETRAALVSMAVEQERVDFCMGVLREFIDGVSSRIHAVREKVERVQTGFEKNDHVFLKSDPSKVFTIVDFQDMEDAVSYQAAAVHFPAARLSEVTGDGYILTEKTVALSELEKFPSTGEQVLGDYIAYPNSVTDTWKMLGVFAFRVSPSQPVRDRILIGSVSEDFGGLTVEKIEELLVGKGRILPVDDYVDIKRGIRGFGGVYRDFASLAEFTEFQRDMQLRRDQQLAKLREKLDAIR